MSGACATILDAIGNTPVVPLNRVAPAGSARILGKFEAGNPGCSLKDRLALKLIDKFAGQGRINPGAIVVAATAGNTGVSLAMVCAVHGFCLHLFMPEDVSLEKRALFAHCGATVHLTPVAIGVGGARRTALDFVSAHQKALFLNQFGDADVARAHVEGTAMEILEDFPQGVDAFVMGVGTGGTITGVGQVLKEKFPATRIIAVEPESSAVLSGGAPGHSRIQQLGLGFVPENLRRDIIDGIEKVDDAEAFRMVRRLAAEEGLLVGISSGANVVASLRVAKSLGAGKTVLTVFCDQGQRYFSLSGYFEEQQS